MDERSGFSTIFGILLGAFLVLGFLVIGFDFGAEKIKTAGLSMPPPLLFVPK